MQSAIQIKVNKSNFTRIKCADKECFKTRQKQSLAYRFLEYNYIIYLSLVSVTSMLCHSLLL